MILICATNRPDELDESFMRPGRIDREIHIGLPGEDERVSIFGVHSSGRPLAKDLDFSKVGNKFEECCFDYIVRHAGDVLT